MFGANVTFLLFLSIAFSPGYVYVSQKFLGLIQFLLALGVGLLIVRLMRHMPRRVLERTLLVLWTLILTASVLEILGITVEASNAFRDWAYGGYYSLIDPDLRDINLVGWVRPKVFSSEPSHVTKFFIATVNAWLILRVSWQKTAVVASATLAMLVIMGSPMLLASAAITLAILLWNHRANLGTRVRMILTILLIAGLFGSLYGMSTYSNVVSRVTDVGASMEAPGTRATSEQRRIVYPYLILADAWSRWPLFGVGIGGTEIIARYSSVAVDSERSPLGNNSMAELWIYLGALGGAWFTYLVLREARETGVKRLVLMVTIVVLFSQLMSGVATFRYWGFIALFWGALATADTKDDDCRMSIP